MSRRNGFSATHMTNLNSGISTRASQPGSLRLRVQDQAEHPDRDRGADAEDDRVDQRGADGAADADHQPSAGREDAQTAKAGNIITASRTIR